MKTPVLLTFNLPEDKAKKIGKLCAKLDVVDRAVKKSEQHETIGALCGMAEPSGTPAEEGGFSEEMLVLCNLSANQQTELLTGLRTVSGSAVELKAVLTIHNYGWSANRLVKEIGAERDAMAQSRRAQHR